MAARGESDKAERAASPLGAALRRPFESLPSRIITSVFAAALVTSGLVTWTSTQSTEAFLRSKMEDRFPTRLGQTARNLRDWYAQRQLDIETFARSDTVVESLTGHRRALEEARKYLGYVKKGFPQYRSLFVLDETGETGVRVGAEIEFPEAQLASLAAIRTAGVSGVQHLGGLRSQIISAPILAEARVLGTLHAVIPLHSIESLLAPGEELDPTSRLYVVGPDGEILVAPSGPQPGSHYERALPDERSVPLVEDYVDAAGEHVVGSSRRFPQFGWTLVVEESYDLAFAPIVSVIRKILAINLGIVVVFGVLAFLIARSIVRPIRALSEGARRIARGETDVELPPSNGQDEIGVLSRALNEMIARLTAANEELRRGNEMLEQLSFTDGLTRLHNHRFFQDRLQMEMRRSDRSGEPLGLVLIDIDDFKLLNDRFGHAVGDEVLCQVARVLNDTVRETDVPARYGGEEFTVIAPATDMEGVVILAEKLRESVSRKSFGGEGLDPDVDLDVTVSIGVSIYHGDPKAFFNEADRALYRAKDAGKDCVVCESERSES